jgi:hypothetical protein
MIRRINSKDKNSLASYFSNKLNINIEDALVKTNKILKSNSTNFIKEERELSGVCWIETRLINNIKTKYIEILVNNWRLAEQFLQCLRWSLNGEHWFSLPKHDFLNRTLNKAGIRFIRVEGDRNIYCYRFEKRDFRNYKSDDIE